MRSLLSVEDLHVVFETDRGVVRAVNGASFAIPAGATMGLVGESGCGKSVTAAAILRLLPSPPGRVTRGRVLFEGRDLLTLRPEELRAVRGREIAMVFQDPLSALNPVLRVGLQVTELVQAHRRGSTATARRMALEALRDVGLPEPETTFAAYPHELSGGQRQRALIAMAIVLRPKLVIADEPTTALDVTIQAQLIQLMRRLVAQHRMALLLISHDLGVVAQLSDRVAVMYGGSIVEEAPMLELLRQPRHPYTQGLLDAVPWRHQGRLPSGIPGTVPDPIELPSGCPFHPRCARVVAACRERFPETTSSSTRRFACYNPVPEG